MDYQLPGLSGYVQGVLDAVLYPSPRSRRADLEEIEALMQPDVPPAAKTKGRR